MTHLKSYYVEKRWTCFLLYMGQSCPEESEHHRTGCMDLVVVVTCLQSFPSFAV